MKKHYYNLGLFLTVSLLLTLLQSHSVNATATVFSQAHQFPAGNALNQNSPSITNYEFSDGEWAVKVSKVNGELRYEGSNINQSKGIRITGGKKSKKNGRFVYTWKNNNISYIVIWNPNDPSFARLQVTESGRLKLNKLLNTTEKAQ
jgi:hypothetical protein